MKLHIEIYPNEAEAEARAYSLRTPPGGGTPKPNIRTANLDEIALFDRSSNPGTESVIAKADGPIHAVLFDQP